MTSSDYVQLQIFLINFVQQVMNSKGYNMGVVQYSNNYQLEWNLGDAPYNKWVDMLIDIEFSGGATSDLASSIQCKPQIACIDQMSPYSDSMVF